jgi:hypothetical protein
MTYNFLQRWFHRFFFKNENKINCYVRKIRWELSTAVQQSTIIFLVKNTRTRIFTQIFLNFHSEIENVGRCGKRDIYKDTFWFVGSSKNYNCLRIDKYFPMLIKSNLHI